MRKALYIGLAVAAAAAVLYIGRPEGSLEEQVKSRVETTESNSQSESEPAANTEPLPAAPGFNLEVPNFSVETTGGQTVSLADLAQDKPTVVGFWASWCHNCQRNLPNQQVLFDKYKDQLNIIEVNLGEKRSTVDRYLSDKDFSFLTAYDEDNIVSRQWGIRYTNTHYLIDSSGKLVAGFPGDLTEARIQELLNT